GRQGYPLDREKDAGCVAVLRLARQHPRVAERNREVCNSELWRRFLSGRVVAFKKICFSCAGCESVSTGQGTGCQESAAQRAGDYRGGASRNQGPGFRTVRSSREARNSSVDTGGPHQGPKNQQTPIQISLNESQLRDSPNSHHSRNSQAPATRQIFLSLLFS